MLLLGYGDIMQIERLLPTVQILLSVGSCIAYLFAGEYRKAVYWGAAAVLTASVTY